SQSTLINLEWLYMPVLSSHGSRRLPVKLHQELTRNPEFFVEILKFLYKPKNYNKETSKEEISDTVKNRALQAYELLNSWNLVPGADENGHIDSHYLNNWVDRVRKLALEVDRLEMADVHIGMILAQYPEKRTDWP